MTEYLIIAAVFMSVLSFILMGVDKFLAKKQMWRISEKTLLLSALCMGAVGAYVGMYTFRHKTKHKKFTLGVPLLIIVNIAVIVFGQKLFR